MDKIILDTTELHRDPYLSKNALQILREFAIQGFAQVIIPETALLEACKHGRQNAEKWLRDAQRHVGHLEGMSTFAGLHIHLKTPTLTELQESYVRQYRLTLEERGFQIWPTPKALSVDQVRDRDLAQVKPFSDGGKGLRDTLIWETVLDVARSTPVGTVHFVTNNSNDFCKDGLLHPDLQAELGEPEKVVHWSDLDDLTTSPHFYLDYLQHIPDLLEGTPNIDGVIKEALSHTLGNLYGVDLITEYSLYGELNFFDAGVPAEFDDPYIGDVDYSIEETSWTITQVVDETTALGTAEIPALITIQAYLRKADIFTLDDIEIVDSDWNDHMVVAARNAKGVFNFELQWELGNEESVEVRLLGIEPSGE